MKINKTVYELNVLLDVISHTTLIYIGEQLITAKTGLNVMIDELNEYTFEFDENIGEISSMKEQLEIVEKNLKTVNTALMIKEADVFEHCIELAKLDLDIHIIGLN